MPEKDRKLIQRSGHGVAAVSFNSEYVELVLFNDHNNADTVVVGLGENFR